MSKDAARRFFIVLAMSLGFALLLGSGLWALFEEGALPAPFRISPPNPTIYIPISVFHNPKSGRYVAFYSEWSAARSVIWSRLFDASGRAVSSPYAVLVAKKDGYWIAHVAYNPVDDRALLVYNDMNGSTIRGQVLTGEGKILPGFSTMILKPAAEPDSGISPRAIWLPALSRWGVAWKARFRNPSEARRGLYLSVFDSRLRRIVAPKKIFGMTDFKTEAAINDVFVASEKIFFSTGMDAGPGLAKPVVFFTDQRGNSAGGPISPGPGAGNMLLRASYNEHKRLLLLHWTALDRLEFSQATKGDTFYRIMDLEGKFKTPVRKLPRSLPFQYDSRSVCLAGEGRFFLVTAECKTLFSTAPRRVYWGGKVQGFYVSNTGVVQTKAGASGGKAIALTGRFMDPDQGMSLGPVAFNFSLNEVLASYYLSGLSSQISDIWGVIYR